MESFMNYIVLDLEWNQPIDGIKTEDRKLPFEIIEIGAIMLNSGRHPIGEFSQIVKPVVYDKINEITKNLVHIKMNDLKNGRLFPEVMAEFLEWCGDDYIFCTWGSLDLLELQRNMNYHGLAPLSDGPIKYLDIQKLFSIAFENKKERRALEYAVDYLQIKNDIPFHRAFSDAYYTAKVLEAIDSPDVFLNYSYDTYHIPSCRKEEIHVLFSDYAKYISKGFDDKTAAMMDREVTSTRCYLCKRPIKKKIRWFSPNGKHFLSVSYCEKHGYMKGKIRLKKTDDGQVYVVKTLKFITIDDVATIYAKREKARVIHSKYKNGQIKDE